MKKVWPKYFAIGLLIVSNTALAAIILLRDPLFQNLRRDPAKRNASEKKALTQSGNAGVHGPASLAQKTGVQACYRSLLMRNPGVSEGAVEVHWTIDDQGRARSIELARTDLDDADFASCIIEKIKAASFPPAPTPDGQIMAHKFNFKTRSPSSVNF